MLDLGDDISGINVELGTARAEPAWTIPQPRSVPTTVSAAAPGWAQPLAQPEMWMSARLLSSGVWKRTTATSKMLAQIGRERAGGELAVSRGAGRLARRRQYAGAGHRRPRSI